MNLSISIRTPVARHSEADFVVGLLVDMLAPSIYSSGGPTGRRSAATALADPIRLASNQDEGQQLDFIVGRVWAERLDWLAATECKLSLRRICDCRSGAWAHMLDTLSRDEGRSLRSELGLQANVKDIVFVHELLVHPEISDRLSVVSAVLQAISSERSLVLMQHEQAQAYHLEEWECRDLGFKKIARSNLLLRDNQFISPFALANPAGRPIDFTANAEHEAWLVEEWEQLVTDHPAR